MLLLQLLLKVEVQKLHAEQKIVQRNSRKDYKNAITGFIVEAALFPFNAFSDFHSGRSVKA